MSRRSLVVVWGIPWVIAAACGGRTGQDLPTYGDGGAGMPTGSGAAFGTGGVTMGFPGSAGAVGKPKPVPVGTGNAPPIGVGNPPPAQPPPPFGGFGNAVGGAPPIGGRSFGGFPTGGTPINCSSPVCACGDCYSTCVCRLGAIGSVALCNSMCFGGTGGTTGTGGFAGAAGATCSEPDSGVTVLCPSAQVLLPNCCTSSGACGVLIDVSGNASVPIAQGCQELNQPGNLDARCPDLGTLIGSPQIGQGLPGCCRSDGLCGLNADAIGLGCLMSTRNGSPFSCSGQIADAGPD